MTISDLERRRLRATKPHLDQRWVSLGSLLSTSFDEGSRAISVDPEYQAAGVWTGLRGSSIERIERNRGTGSVAPFLRLPDNLSAWLGYQEVWDQEGGRSPFVFRQASLTVHVGEIGDPVKPQILRLEWPGLRDWDRSGIGFQSPNAGHPHWQLDLLESLQDAPDPRLPAVSFSDEVESFDDVIAGPTLIDRVTRLTFERMHLASAAPWWSAKPSARSRSRRRSPLPVTSRRADPNDSGDCRASSRQCRRTGRCR